VDRDSLEIGDGGRAKSVGGDKVRPAASILEFVGTGCEVPGDASSGFAMRKPPKD
jgi:hypothetical protein